MCRIDIGFGDRRADTDDFLETTNKVYRPRANSCWISVDSSPRVDSKNKEGIEQLDGSGGLCEKGDETKCEENLVKSVFGR